MGEEQHEGLAALAAVRWHEWRGDRRVIGAVCACVAVAAGVAWWRSGASSGPPPPAPRAAGATTFGRDTPTPTTAGGAVVDVEGAVRRPGIVRLPADARVIDAIGAAGGPEPGADLARVNLAARVADGARIAVPKIGAPAPAIDPSAVSGTAGGTGDANASGPVNLNTATAAQLDALPGVGPATAAAIVHEREAHGPFRSVDDLRRVRGIGPAKLAQLHDLVSV